MTIRPLDSSATAWIQSRKPEADSLALRRIAVRPGPSIDASPPVSARDARPDQGELPSECGGLARSVRASSIQPRAGGGSASGRGSLGIAGEPPRLGPFRRPDEGVASERSTTAATRTESGNRTGSTPALRELDRVSHLFESLLFREMIHAMVEGSTEQGFFGEGAGAGAWEDLFETGLSDSLGSEGKLGIARQIYGQFEPTVRRQAAPAPSSQDVIRPADLHEDRGHS